MKIIFANFILVFSVLLTGCVTITTTPLRDAAVKGDVVAVKELLDKGADVNEWSYGSALIIASETGNTNMAKLLIDRGADVNLMSKGGWSALGFAAENGHIDIVDILIEKGADINMAITGLEVRADQLLSFPEIAAKNKRGIKLLAKIVKKQEIASRPVMPVLKPSQEVSPAIKSDVDEFPTIKAKPNKNSFAIVIGIENYRQKLPKADFSTSDAKLVAEYLTKALGYPEENVVTLLNDRAALGDMVKYFEKWLGNNVEAGSTVFIYFSGHGAPNTKTGDAFLVPYDGDPSFIDQTGYSLKRMYDALSKLPAKRIIVALDSCFSGTGGRSVIAKGSRPLVMNLQANTILPKNMTVLTASSGDQTSSTYDEKGHGLFTYFLLKGIKNEDVVMPDGSIRMDDLFGYIKPQVERIARKQYNNEQTPQLIAPKPANESPRSKLRGI